MATRLRRLVLTGLLGLLLPLGCLAQEKAPATAERPLVFGVFPNLSAKQVLELYRPLADVLEQRLKRRIDVYSAPDFRTFVMRTRQGEYDILLTAPHLAWLARQEAGYRPLLKYAQPTRGLVVVRRDSSFQEPADMRGRTIAVADPLAVAVMAAQAELAEQNLRPERDYTRLEAGTHVNALMQVLNQRADAAVVGLPPFLMLDAGARQQLRVLLETPPLSSQMFLSHPRLRDREAQALRAAMLDFAATPAGQAFMRRGGFGGFASAEGNELQAFRPYALQVQDVLRESR